MDKVVPPRAAAANIVNFARRPRPLVSFSPFSACPPPFFHGMSPLQRPDAAALSAKRSDGFKGQCAQGAMDLEVRLGESGMEVLAAEKG